MSKKIYDLSIGNQTAEERRILIADSGKEYDVSFVPAILNRKYYKAWTQYQRDVMKGLSLYNLIQRKLAAGGELTKEDRKHLDDFVKLTKEAANTGNDLIVYAMRANGYEEFNEDELMLNFSERGAALAINFIIGIEDAEEVKKKAISSKKA